MKVIVSMLASVLLLASFVTSAETVGEAEARLQQLEKQSLAHEKTLSQLLSEQKGIEQERAKARAELEKKEADLAQVGKDMQDAIKKAYAEPSSDNEREAHNLSRSFTLAERTVSMQQLDVERAERKHTELQQAIASAKVKINQTQQDIKNQKARISQLKEQALARARQPVVTPKPVPVAPPEPPKPQQPPSEKPAEPKVVEAKTEKKEEQPEEAAPISLEEQLENINRHISNNSGW